MPRAIVTNLMLTKLTVTNLTRLLWAIAAVAIALCFNVPASRAGGNAPWCAVIDYGDGGVSWDCYYRTFEECYPNVLAGNKGSCNLNPAGPGPAFTPAPYRYPRHYAH